MALVSVRVFARHSRALKSLHVCVSVTESKFLIMYVVRILRTIKHTNT